MGGLFSSIMDQISGYFGQKEMRILVLGLDNAGKTTLVYRLQLNDVIETSPTLGFNVEVVKYKNITFQVWDLGGQDSIRPYWRCYYLQTSAIIYVVDSCDRERMHIAKNELHMLTQEEELKGCKIIVFANKQDMDGQAMNVAEVSQALDLTSLTNVEWTIMPTSAKQGTGVQAGMEWLHNKLTTK